MRLAQVIAQIIETLAGEPGSFRSRFAAVLAILGGALAAADLGSWLTQSESIFENKPALQTAVEVVIFIAIAAAAVWQKLPDEDNNSIPDILEK